MSSELWTDIRYSWRRLRRSPASSSLCVLTLALGVGTSSATFSHVNNVLFKPIPLAHAERLVTIVEWNATQPTPFHGVFNKYLPWLFEQDLAHLDELAAVKPVKALMTIGSSTERLAGEAVTGNYFGLLGVRPRIGRILVAADDGPGQPPVVMLSERLWRSAFSANPSILGQPIELSGVSAAVVGVVPESFRGLVFSNISSHDFWVSRSTTYRFADAKPERTPHTVYGVIGRLAADADFSEADAEIRTRSRRFDPSRPNEALALADLERTFAPPFVLRGVGAGLLLLSALVVMIAGANLSGLILARARTRAPEMALRITLGAEAPHIRQLLLTESLILSLAGGLAGVGAAWLASRSVGTVVLPPIKGALLRYDATPDWQFALYGLLMSVAASVAVALTSTTRSMEVNPAEALASGGKPVALGDLAQPVRSRLVIVQVACALVLLMTAGWLAQSLRTATRFQPRVDRQRTAIASIDLPVRLAEADARRVYDRVLAIGETLPGVTHAAIASGVPIGRSGASGPYVAVGGAVPGTGRALECRTLSATPGLFETLGLVMLRGRDFTAHDGPTAVRVAVITRTVASNLWPNADPIGRWLRPSGWNEPSGEIQVIGVIDDPVPASKTVAEADRRFVFLPIAQNYDASVMLIVRGQNSGQTVLAPMRETIAASVPQVRLFNIRTLDDYLYTASAGLRTATMGVVALGAVGLVLALTGLFATVGFVMGTRARDFAIMMALGASRRHVYATAGKEGIRILTLGLCAGLLLFVSGAAMLRPLLVGGVGSVDMVTFVAAPLSILTAGLAACFGAARRVARVDPLSVIREL